MKKYAIILAGGVGSRAGGDIPKQFRKVGGMPMLWWSIKAFRAEDADTQIIVVMHPDYIDFWNDFILSLPGEDIISHIVTTGGSSRLESVQNGLHLIEDEDALIAVHDAARPMVTQKMIADGWETALKYCAAVPVVPVCDSLRKLDDTDLFLENARSESVIRSEYVAVQTPQVFDSKLLKEAYALTLNNSMTDDASVAEAAGHKVGLFEGDSCNIKVTNPVDFYLAEYLLSH